MAEDKKKWLMIGEITFDIYFPRGLGKVDPRRHMASRVRLLGFTSNFFCFLVV